MRCLNLALVAGALAVSAGQIASAADMPVATKAPAMVAPPPITWTGFYLGLHGGGAWANSDWGYTNAQPYSATGPGVPPSALRNSFDPTSWVAGGQFGYNYQTGQWVLGFELAGSATGLSQTVLNVVQYPPIPGNAGNTVYVGTEVEALFTAAGRVGFLVAPQWLLFAKGGYAGGNVKTSGNFVPAGVPPVVLNFATTEWHHGWTVGAGLEYRINRNWSIGASYDYIDLTQKTHTGNIFLAPGSPANAVIHPVQVDLHVVTARLNYLFAPN